MNKETFSKSIAAGVLGIFMALAIHTDHVNQRKAGRDAFITKETVRWDQHYANPDSVVTDVIVALVACGVFFSVYEVLTFGALLLVKRISVDDIKKQAS